MALLEIKNLQVSLKEEGKTIVKKGDITINPGEIVLLLGGNGSGKTTLISSIFDSEKVNSSNYITNYDKIVFNDKEIQLSNEEDMKNIWQNSSFVRQDNTFIGSSINYVKNSASYAGKFNYSQVNHAAKEIFNVFDMNKIKYKRCQSLSGGQNKLINIMAGLIREPLLLILDEPLNNLDGKNAKMLSNYLIKIAKEKNVGILIITHCRMFPKVSRAYEIFQGVTSEQPYQYKSCYGIPNEEGFYKI